MSHPYQFRLDIIQLVIEQDVGIREVAKLHHIPHSSVIHWLKASTPEKSETENEKERN